MCRSAHTFWKERTHFHMSMRGSKQKVRWSAICPRPGTDEKNIRNVMATMKDKDMKKKDNSDKKLRTDKGASDSKGGTRAEERSSSKGGSRREAAEDMERGED